MAAVSCYVDPDSVRKPTVIVERTSGGSSGSGGHAGASESSGGDTSVSRPAGAGGETAAGGVEKPGPAGGGPPENGGETGNSGPGGAADGGNHRGGEHSGHGGEPPDGQHSAGEGGNQLAGADSGRGGESGGGAGVGGVDAGASNGFGGHAVGSGGGDRTEVGGNSNGGLSGRGDTGGGDGGESGAEVEGSGGVARNGEGGEVGNAEPCQGVEGCRCLPGLSPAIFCGTSDRGLCRFGKHECLEATGQYGPCVGAILPQDETCDGEDNDCDGYEDFGKDSVSGWPISACTCDYEDYDITEEGGNNTFDEAPLICAETKCSISPDGSLVMEVCHDCSTGSAWSTCRFALGQDLSRFDASGANDGILEVWYCLDAPIPAEVALWYGVANPQYNRKKLVLARAGDPLGCRPAYFEPQDACFGPLPGLNPGCVGRCGNDLPADCIFDYHSATLQLTVAGCIDDQNEDLDDDAPGAVRLLSVTHLSDTCRCLDDSSCKSGSRTSCASVSGDLSVCVDSGCVGSGEPCTTIVDDKECHASLQCLDGSAVCPTTGCEQ